MLGVVNQLYTLMEEKWPDQAMGWAKAALARSEVYHGGSFEGRQCKLLLTHLRYFEDSQGNPKDFEMAPYLVALKKFNVIRENCFKATLVEGFDHHQAFNDFMESFLVLHRDKDWDYEASVIFKVHEMFFHVAGFMDRYPTFPLGLISEQTSESLHSKFTQFSRNRLMKSTNSPKYPQNFLDVVVAFNSKRIGAKKD